MLLFQASHPLLPTPLPHVRMSVFCLHLHCYPANNFISTIFLDRIYVLNSLNVLVMCCCCCSVTKSHLTLFNTCTAACQASLSFTVSQSLLKHMTRVNNGIQPSHLLPPPSPPALHLSHHQGLFHWVYSALGGQSIEASASASILPVNSQGWFP